jgi:hypothetical protein
MNRRLPFLVGVASITALLLTSVSSVAVTDEGSVKASPSLTSQACLDSLQLLSTEQRKKLASPATLESTALSCDDAGVSLPKAQYVTVTANGNTIGGVFAFEKTSRLSLPNQSDVTFLLINGHTMANSAAGDVYEIRNIPATVSFGETTHPAKLTAYIGDGGSRIDLRLLSPLGTVKPALATAASRPYREGTPVVVFTEKGPVRTTVGKSYEGKWQTVNGTHFGIVVASSSGQYIGQTGWFGTQYDPGEQARFWRNHAYLIRYKK